MLGMQLGAKIFQRAPAASPVRNVDGPHHIRSKRGDYVKILTWDGSGLCLFAKRLEKGRFVWPPIVEGALHLTPAQLALLIEGIDWRRTVAPQAPERPSFL